MPLIAVKAVGELPPATVVEVRAGGETYALCNVDGRLHCLSGRCPHMGGPLGQGVLCGTRLMCPWHGWEFDSDTGRNCDGGDGVVSYPVIVRDGWICIETADAVIGGEVPTWP